LKQNIEPLAEIDWYAAVYLSSLQLKLCLTFVFWRSILIHAPQCHTREFVALLCVSSDAGRDAGAAFAFVERAVDCLINDSQCTAGL
jgi:hypothetical protein